MRVISGRWKEVQEPFPNLKDNPEVFQSQYCHDEAEAKCMISWDGRGERSQSAFAGKGKPTSGGKGKGTSNKSASGGNEEAAEPSYNTVVMRDHAHKDRHCRRDARVCGLADLFEQFGEQWTANEILEYYESLYIFAYKRERGRSAPERRVAAAQRYRDTGRYGLASWQ